MGRLAEADLVDAVGRQDAHVHNGDAEEVSLEKAVDAVEQHQATLDGGADQGMVEIGGEGARVLGRVASGIGGDISRTDGEVTVAVTPPGKVEEPRELLQRRAFNSTHEPTAPVSRSRIPTSRTTL